MELPQGGWEQADAAPEAMARGELREETGLTAERMTLLATLRIGYGVLNQKQHIFLAEGLTQGERELDAEESDLEVRRVSVAQFEAMLLDGTIVDGCSAAAWGVYRLWRERRIESVAQKMEGRGDVQAEEPAGGLDAMRGAVSSMPVSGGKSS